MNLKKALYGLIGVFVIGGALLYNNGSFLKTDHTVRVESAPQYTDLSWNNLVNKYAESVVVGKVKSVDGKVEAVKIDDSRYLYANSYTVEIHDKLKGAKNKQELKVEVLEEDDPSLKKGDKIVLFATLKDGNTYVPVGGNLGLFKVKNGKALGTFIDKNAEEVPLDHFVAEIRQTVESSKTD